MWSTGMFRQIYNFKQLSDNLFTSGMPTKEQMEDMGRNGIQVVINLAPHTVQNALSEEEALVKSLSIDYYNIPVSWNSPTLDNLSEFMNIMDQINGKKVFVHCEANFRASSFVTMYRILRLGWDPDQAMNVMHEIWDEEVYPIWKEFIEEILDKEKNKRK